MTQQKPDAVLRIVARYLMERGPGYVYTTAELRRHVLAVTGKDFVQLDRRVRDLRDYRWVIHGNREDRTLKPAQHRLVRVGDDVTHPACERRARGCPPPVRRQVYMRDGRQCKVCGIRDGEEYLDWPGRFARMTIGRKLPGSRGGLYTVSNCQVECMMCNEAVRDKYYPETGLGQAA